MGGVQLHAHAGALGALAGEEHAGLAGGPRAADDAGVLLAVGQRPQSVEEFVAVGAGDDGPVLEGGAGGGQRVRHVQRGEAGDAVQEAAGLRAQGVGALGGQQPRQDGRDDRGGRRLGRLVGGGLLEDDVGVGAAHAEGGHGRAARGARLRPLPGLGEELDGAGVPVDHGGGLVDVERAGQHAVPHGLDHLDDAADAGRRHGVADVGLQRAQVERPLRGPALAVRGQQGLGLDRVAEPGAGAVGLDDVDIGGREPGALQRLADDPFLGGAVGGGQAVGGAVLVHGGAADHGEDLVAVLPGVGQLLDEDQADALGPRGAVGGRGEGLDAAVGGEAALPGEVDEAARGRGDGGAAGQRQRRLALPHRLDGQVQRDQRRRAGGVHGQGRALEAEGVGDAAGGDAVELAREQVALELLGPVEPEVALLDHAGEDAHPAAAQADRVDAGLLEGLPGGLQQHALLGVHRLRLTRRDAEEAGVELGGAVEESALAGVRGAGGGRVRVVELLQVPAAVGGERRDAVHAALDHPPQVVRRAHPAGEPAGHADDRDGLLGARLQLGEPGAGLLQVGRHPFEVLDQLLFVGGLIGHAESLLEIRKSVSALSRRNGRARCR